MAKKLTDSEKIDILLTKMDEVTSILRNDILPTINLHTKQHEKAIKTMSIINRRLEIADIRVSNIEPFIATDNKDLSKKGKDLKNAQFKVGVTTTKSKKIKTTI